MQQQFHLPKTLAHIDSFTPRAEKHGKKQTRPAGTLKLTVSAHSSILDYFGTQYRPFLFRKPAAGEEQTSDLTEIAEPKLESLKLREKFPGYQLQIDTGMELAEPTVLDDVELCAFTFEAVRGGVVKVSLQANCHPSNDEEFGVLCKLIQNKVDVTLIPPGPDAQGNLNLAAGDGEASDDNEAGGDTLEQQEAQEERERLAKLAAGDGEEE